MSLRVGACVRLRRQGALTAPGKGSAPPPAEAATGLLTYYREQCLVLDKEIAAATSAVALARALVRTGPADAGASGTCFDITCSVHFDRGGEFSLEVVYQVTAASWKPSYDVRMTSTDDTLAVTYYGKVRQNTGEAWTGCRLNLSTVAVHAGGSAPTLPTRRVGVHGPYMGGRLERAGSGSDDDERNLSTSESAPRGRAIATKKMAVSSSAPPKREAGVATASVSASGGSAMFTIERPAMIDSDDKPHSVTIVSLSLASKFRHYCTPALSPAAYVQVRLRDDAVAARIHTHSAYLLRAAVCLCVCASGWVQATTTNTSPYLLLASEQVNVFCDGSFIAQTRLNDVNPGESFRSFLGVDPCACMHASRALDDYYVGSRRPARARAVPLTCVPLRLPAARSRLTTA